MPVTLTDASVVVKAEMKDLSASGVYCALDQFIPPMTKLQLTFDLVQGAHRSTIRCAGVVVRIEPSITMTMRAQYDVAIFFTELAARHRAAITRFVRRRLAAHPSASA